MKPSEMSFLKNRENTRAIKDDPIDIDDDVDEEYDD